MGFRRRALAARAAVACAAVVRVAVVRVAVVRVAVACTAAVVLAACGGPAAGTPGSPTTSGARPASATSDDGRSPTSPPAATTSAGAGTGGTGSIGSTGGTGVPAGTRPPVASGGEPGFTRLPTPTGRLLVSTLAGRESGVRMKVWVWLPPQYDDPANARTSFPALMLYPGGSGAGYNTWAGPLYGAQRLVSEGAAKGTVTPFVFVMPAMQLSERLDTECADLPGQPRVGTFLSVDVRRLVEDTFRVQRDRTAWGAVGASSGAYCATRLVFNHPDAYAAVASIDGYFSIQTALAGGKDAGIRAQDPSAIAVADPPAVSVLLWSGDTAKVDLQQARDFQALVRPPTTARLEVLPGGQHLTTDFAKMMPLTFAFLTERLAEPVAG